MDQFFQNSKEGQMPRPPSAPLAEAAESFFRSQHHLSEHTRRSYVGSLRRFDAFMRGDLRDVTIADLTAENVNRYLASVADHRYMARSDCAVLKVFAKWLVRARILPHDPLAPVAKPKIPKWRPRPLADAVIPELVDEAGASELGVRDRAIVITALDTGARPNELRQVRWPEDVDLRNRVVRIREDTSKTPAGHREVPIDAQTVAALDEYVKDYRPDLAGPLFLNARGRPFAYYGWLALFQRLRRRLEARGVEGFQAYRLRHSALTNKARSGWGAHAIQQVAGHADIRMSSAYVGQLSVAELRRLPAAMTEVYGRLVG